MKKKTGQIVFYKILCEINKRTITCSGAGYDLSAQTVQAHLTLVQAKYRSSRTSFSYIFL